MLQLLGLLGLVFLMAGPLAGTAYADDGVPPAAPPACDAQSDPEACAETAQEPQEAPPDPASLETECLPDPENPESCAPSADESADPSSEPASDELLEQPAEPAEPQPQCTPNPDDPGSCQPAPDDTPADPASSGETCDPEAVDCQLDIPLDLAPAELSLPEDGQEPAAGPSLDEELPEPASDDVVAPPDPYLYYGGVQYTFVEPIPGLPGFACLFFPNCTESPTPIQAAISFAEAQYDGPSSLVPDLNTIYIEPDIYSEPTITLDGIAFALRLLGQGGTPTLSGSVSVTNSSGAITLENLIFSSTITVEDSPDVTVIGTAAADAFQVAFAGSGSSNLSVDGLGGSDSLYIIGTGTDDTITPRLDSIALGSEVITFTGVETVEVYGMSGNDTFALDESSLFTGALDGGADTDTISYASWSSALNIDLDTTPYPGLAGTVSNVERVEATSLTDTLTGPSGGTTFYAQTTNNSVLVGGTTFLSIENVAGGAGTDTLDASALSTGVTIDLGGTSGFTGILWTGFENAVGGSGNDTLISSSANNVMNGGLGDDEYVFFDAWGTDAVTDPGGTDTFNFSGVTTDLAIGLDFTSGAEDITIITTGGDLTLSGVPFIERFFAGDGDDSLTFDAGGNRMTYEISDTQVTLTYVPTVGNYLFDGIESYYFPNTVVAFTSADETLLVAALQAFTNYMYALEGYSYLAAELPGLLDGMGDALTLAALLEPGNLLQTYLVNAVSNAISTNWTLQEVANAITGAVAEAGVTLWHGTTSPFYVAPTIDWQFNCTTVACVDLATIQMLFWISRNKTVTLSLNQTDDLVQQGLVFENDLGNISLYADLYYSLRFGLSKSEDNAFVDDLVSGYASSNAERFLFYTTSPASDTVEVDVVYGFLRVETEDFSYSIDQFLDVYDNDPTGLDGHSYTADWNTITADLPGNTLGYVSAAAVTGAGYSINLGIQSQAVGAQVPNLGFSDWNILISSTNVFQPAMVTIDWDDPDDEAFVAPFVNTTADQVYDLLGNLAAWLAGYSGSDQFDQIIPFTEALLLGQFLNFGIGFQTLLDPLLKENGTSDMLCDPYDPGALGAADDGSLCFRDARQFAEAVHTILSYSNPFNTYFEYDTAEHVLTYDIAFAVTTSQAVPVYMGYDLSPFSGLQISGTVLTTVSGYMYYDFKLAFDLDANLEAIIRADVGSVPTLMAYQLPVPLGYEAGDPLGRTNADIAFTIQLEADTNLTGSCLGVNDPVGAPDPDYYRCTFNLTLLAADTTVTTPNTSIDDLVLDLNNMFAGAGLGSYLEATVENGSDLLYRISALPDQGINSIAITAADVNLWQIGLAAPAVHVSAENIPYTLGSNLTFTATLHEHGGASNVFVITVDAAETAGNASLEDLITDINFAIAAVPGASSQIKASRMLVTSEEQIGLYALSGAVEYMTVTPNTFFVSPLLVKDAELPAASPLVDGVTSDFSVDFDLSVDNVTYNIDASFLMDDTIDVVVAKLNAALNAELPAALDDKIKAELIFDERVGGVCPAGYGDVMRTDPFTGLADGTGLVLYRRDCYADRIALVAQDTSIALMVIKSDAGNFLRDRIGLDVGLYGRRGSNHLALLGYQVDAGGDPGNDPYLYGDLNVDVCTYDGLNCGNGFDATMLLGFAGLTIVDAAFEIDDATLAFDVRLFDPASSVAGVALDVLLNNGHDEDTTAAPGVGFEYVADLSVLSLTAAIDLPVVAQPEDAAFGISNQVIPFTFTNWFIDPSGTSIPQPPILPDQINWPTLPGLAHARALEDVTFTEVIALFQGAVDYLNALHADPTARLTTPLPFLGMTVRQLLDYAPIFAAKVAILAGNPVINAQQFQVLLDSVFPGAAFFLDTTNWTDLRFSLTDNVSGSLAVPLSIYFPSFQDPANPFVALEGVQRLYAANEAGYLTVNFSAALNLSGGLNTLLAAGAQRGFLDDTSTLTYSVSARATNMDARLKLAYLDMYTHTCSTGVCAGETAWVAFDGDGNPATVDSAVWSFGLNDDIVDGRHYLDENLLATTSKVISGAAILRLPLFHPDPFTFADELYPVLAVHVPNLSTFLAGSLAGVHMDSDGYPGPLGDGINPLTQYYQIPNLGINAGVLELGSTVNDLLKNVEVLLGGLDTALIVLQNAINQQVFGQRLPFLGDALATLPAAQIFENMRTALMQNLLNAILAADPNLDTAGTIALIQGVILTSWASVLSPLSVTIVDQNPSDGLTCAEDPNPDVLSFCEFHMDLGDTINTQIPFDILLDGLGLTVDATVNLTYAWAWDDFTFGINSIEGFYLDVAALNELTLDLDGSLEYTTPDSVSGTLTFLPFNTLGTTTTDADPEAWSGNTAMDYQIVIDVRDPDNGGRFTFAELADAGTEASQVIYALLSGTYHVHLQVLTSFDGSALFPNLQMDFNAIWTFTSVELDPYRPDLLYDDKPDVQYWNVRLDFGTFLSRYLRPVLDAVFEILQPFAWLIDPQEGFLWQVDPVMSFLSGQTMRIIDEIELLFKGVKYLRPFLNAVAYLYGLAKQMNAFSATALFIPIGALSLPDYSGSSLAGWLRSEIEPLMVVDDTGSFSTSLDLLAVEDPSDQQALEYTKNLCNGSGGSGTTKKRECSTTAGASLGDFSIDFPILSDPGMVLLMLAGQDADLVVVNLPALQLSASIEFKFMVYTPPPVWVKVGGSFQAELDVDFGFDTRGIRTYMITGLPEDIADGFYIIVRDPDTGERVPQLTLTVRIEVGASVSLAILEVGVGGGIEGTAYFYLHDPDNDGKVRWKEIAEVAETNGWIFDVRVKIDLFFNVYVELDFVLFSVTVFDFEVRITVYDKTFNIVLPPRLGTTVPTAGGYLLYLNMGPFADKRFTGDLFDGDELFTVWETGFDGTNADLRIRASLNGAAEYIDARITAYKNIVKVIAFGGEGNDGIDATGLSIPVEFHGGVGNDTLTASNNAASKLWGDDGNDTLNAGTVGMWMNGGAGNDVLNGAGGADTLLGSSGNDTLNGVGGNDGLTGGAGDDVLNGGLNDDTYFFASFSGNDTLLGGDSGVDTLDFQAAYGELGGEISAGRISLTGLGYSVNSGALDIERVLGSRGGGGISVSAAGPGGLFVDGRDGSDVLSVFLGSDFLGPMTVQDTGAAWYVDRLGVHTDQLNDLVTLTEGVSDLTITGNLGGPAFPFQPFSFPNSGHGLEYLNIFLHGGDDVYNAENVTSDLDELPIMIRPDDTDSKGTDTLTGGAANETFLFSRAWGNDVLYTGGAGTDTLDFHILDDPLAISLGADGGVYINSLLLNTDADDPLTEIDVVTGAAATGTVKAQDLLSFTPGANDLIFDWATIEVILGSRRPNDVLAGRDEQGVWQLGLNNENTYTAGGHEVVFKYIESLQGGADVDLFDFTYAERQRFAVKGGAGDDIFRVRDGVLLTDIPSAPYFASAIRSGFNGQTGIDVLDFSYYTAPVTPAVLDLGTGFLSHIVTFLGGATSGRLLEIDAILGTALADVLLGNATAPTTFIGSAGNDTMTGGSGDDHFISGNLTPVPTDDFLIGAATTVFDPIYDDSGTDGADVMNGLGGSDTYNFDNDWDIDTVNDNSGALDTLEFMDLPGAITVTPGLNTIQVVYGLNTFSAPISGLEWVIGTTHDDTFVFGPNTSFTGKLDGYADLLAGPDNDLLDFSGYHTGLTFQAALAGTLDGIQGSVPGPLGAFDNINDLIGTAFADTFQGTALDDIFTIYDDHVEFQNAALMMTFHSIEILNGMAGLDIFNIQDTNFEITRMYGGLDDDTFFMIGAALVPGQLDGDDDPDLLDIDTLDYSQYGSGAVVDLVLGQATGIFGDLLNAIFRIERVVGSASIDTIYGDQFDNILVGDDGLDRLIGREGNDTYVFGDNWGQDEVIELPGQGTDKLDFSGVTVDLTFTLGPNGWSVTDALGPTPNTVTVTTTPGGAVDGEHVESFTGGSGYNLLDVSAWTTGVWDVFITGSASATAPGFQGTLEDLSRPGSLGTFDNLDEFIANPASTNDRLTGADAPGRFTFNAAQTFYTEEPATADVFIFSNFDTLRGGADDDTFALVGNVTIPQFVDGQAGSDTIDYSAYVPTPVPSPVDVDLPNLTATALSGGFIRLENAIGTPLNDIFKGDSNDNTFDGGDGDDTYIFTSGWGADTVIDSGNVLDTDTLDFSALSADLIVNIFGASLSVTDGLNTLDVTLNSLEQIETGAGDDQFIFMDNGAQVSGGVGLLNAGGGVNRIDYQGYTVTSAVVDLSGAADTATGTNGITGFRDIFGGDGNDTLTGDDAQNNVLRGRGGNDILTGGLGTDTLDESWATANLTIDLSVVAAQLTGIGLDTITGIENLITGSGNDTLCGSVDDNLLQGGLGDDTYCFYDNYGNDTVDDSGGANDAMDFSALTLALTFNFGPGLTVAEGLNLVTDLGVNVENLIGGLGMDTFIFANGAVHTGSLDGGPNVAADTIDWSAYTTPRSVVLSGPGTVDGMAGAEAASGAFDNIDFILGGSASDSVLGANAPSVWNPGAGTYATGGQSLSFGGFETLNGNANSDTFEFTGAGVFTGNLNGGGGTDALVYQGYPTDISINLQTFTATDLNGTFGSIETLLGRAGGNDTLIGRDTAGTFSLDGGVDQYSTAAGVWDFSGFDTLMGGALNDTFQILANVTYDLLGGAGNDQFVLGAGGQLNGFLDGGAGTNTLNLSSSALPRIVTLTAPGALVGFDGQEAGLSGGFRNINVLNATTPSSTDSLQGIDQNATWNFGGTNTYSAAGRTLQFSAFENYLGGLGNDVFKLANGVLIPGDADAGPGVDTLDLSAWTTDVFVDLDSGIATGIGGLALNFENANGGSGDDFLYGNALNNVLNGNDGDDYIEGRDGDDTLITGRGTDTLVGGPGIDTGIIHWKSIWSIPFGDVEILIFLSPPAPPEPPLIMLILVNSGQIVPLDCGLCVGFKLRLIGDPLKELFLWKGAASAASLTAGLPELPEPFDDIYHLVDAVSIALFGPDGASLTHSESTMSLTFIVPLWVLNFELAVLHWDEALGQWVVLHPDEVDYSTGRVTVYVDQVGVYLLVVRAEELSLECDGEAALTTEGSVEARLRNGDRIAAGCTDGATLRLWPVVPWLLDAELVEQLHFGWETQVVGTPEGTSLPLTITFGVPAGMRSQVSEALLGEGNDWTTIAFEINGEGAAVELTNTGVLLLMLDQ